jgi:hypothetical protein
MWTTVRAPLTCLTLAFAVAAGGLAPGSPAVAQETSIHRPKMPTQDGIPGVGGSASPSRIAPQLQQSLIAMRHALSILSAAQSEQEFNEAARHLDRAYRLQRAAHGGLAIQERKEQSERKKTPGSLVSQEWAIIDASRKNLLMAHFRFQNARLTEARRLKSGFDYLQAAISQTEMALAMH